MILLFRNHCFLELLKTQQNISISQKILKCAGVCKSGQNDQNDQDDQDYNM